MIKFIIFNKERKVKMKSNKRHVLIIAYNGLGNSGVPNVIYQTIKCLNKNYSFDILVFDNDLYFFNKLKNEGISDIHIILDHLKKPKNKLLRAIYHFFIKPIHNQRLAKKLFKNNFREKKKDFYVRSAICQKT